MELPTPPAINKVSANESPVIPVVATQSADEIPAALVITFGSSGRPLDVSSVPAASPVVHWSPELDLASSSSISDDPDPVPLTLELAAS
jgi:hypothetical protein